MKHTFLLFASILCLASCQPTNVAHVVKEIAEQPVDTSSYEESIIALPALTAVEVNCFADVTYHQCAHTMAPSLRILAPKSMMKELTARVDDEGTMKLNMNTHLATTENSVPVVHLYAPAVNAFVINGGKCLRLGTTKLHSPLQIELNGMGSITADELQASTIDVELNGAGHIDLHRIRTPRLKAELNGAGHIRLTGQAAEAKTSIDGVGTIDTSGLKQ